MQKKPFTVEFVRSLFNYDPETGLISNKHTGTVYKARNKRGYVLVPIEYSSVSAHRLAYALYYGVWPDKSIDHINGVKHDNRIKNLRCVTQWENLHNTVGKLGNKSIQLNRETGKYDLFVMLPSFDTIEEAEEMLNKLYICAGISSGST